MQRIKCKTDQNIDWYGHNNKTQFETEKSKKSLKFRKKSNSIFRPKIWQHCKIPTDRKKK